jgi:hypothetical protein
MRTHLILNSKVYLRLVLIVPAISLLGLTNYAMAGGKVRHNYPTNYLRIGTAVYNSESHGFDRPWPFGPESSQQ